MAEGMPIFLGGDHSLSLGSVAGIAAHARAQGRPLFVLWLDAHTDIHSVATTESGNLHGTPIAYISGRPGFEAFPYPEYSQVFFGRGYPILRGGSWATRRNVIRTSFRNWDLPERGQIFSGLRCAGAA